MLVISFPAHLARARGNTLVLLPSQPALNRLRQKPGWDGVAPDQVGDGARQLEHAVEGAGG